MLPNLFALQFSMPPMKNAIFHHQIFEILYVEYCEKDPIQTIGQKNQIYGEKYKI